MSYAIALRCRKCGREYQLEPRNLCDFCFSPLEVNYDYKSVAKAVSREEIAAGPSSMWRYKNLLPVDDTVVDIGTGFTPLVEAGNLGLKTGRGFFEYGTSYQEGGQAESVVARDHKHIQLLKLWYS